MAKLRRCDNCKGLATPVPWPSIGMVCPLCLVPTGGVQRALRRQAKADKAAYHRQLRRAEKRGPSGEPEPDPFLRADPGNPLGHGYPTGRSLRNDGESHRAAWMRVIREDPCSFCTRRRGGTVDHIEAQSRRARGLGGVHVWLNYAGSCEACNSRKSDGDLLFFMLARHGVQNAKRKRQTPLPRPRKVVPLRPPVVSDRRYIMEQYRRSGAM